MLLKNDLKLEDIRGVLTETFHGNKSLLENELRKSFLGKIKESSENSDAAIRHIKIVLEAADIGLCATSTPFLLLQDSLDVMSRQRCDEIFEFIEKNLNLWKREPMNNAGKNYLLRMCNGLLKRLSPSQDTILCGRIQIFLAQLFPISERSGLNLNGQFNVDNITLYEDQQEFVQFKESRTNFLKTPNDKLFLSEEQIKIDTKLESYEFYQKFWSVQNVFRDPTQCFEPDKWIKFVDNTNDAMDVFLLVHEQEQKSYALSHDNTEQNEDKQEASRLNYYWSSPTKRTPLPNAPNDSTGHNHHLARGKRRRRRTVSTEHGIVEEVNAEAAQMEEDQLIDHSLSGLDNFFAKYLTGSNLLHMQIYDLHFRRCILLQYLFTFQYLLVDSKFKLAHQVLDENQKAWVTTTQQIIYDLLGSKMQGSIKKILTYEEFWNEWKNSGCPNFTKSSPPLPPAAATVASPHLMLDGSTTIEDSTSPPKKNKNGYAKKIHMDLGNPELTALWNFEPDNVKACASEKRNFRPSLKQFMSTPPAPRSETERDDKSALLPNDSALAPGDDALAPVEEEEAKAERAVTRDWKTLRLLSRESKHFFWSYFSNASASNTTSANKSSTPGTSGGTNAGPGIKIVSDFISVLGDKIRAEEVNTNFGSKAKASKRASGEGPSADGTEPKNEPASGQKEAISAVPSRDVSFTDANNSISMMDRSSLAVAKNETSNLSKDSEEQSVNESVNDSSVADKSMEEGEIENLEVGNPLNGSKHEKTPRTKGKASPKKTTSIRSKSKRLKAKHGELNED